jgi:hypothetical protein
MKFIADCLNHVRLGYLPHLCVEVSDQWEKGIELQIYWSFIAMDMLLGHELPPWELTDPPF